jgi:hypothetical protein
MLSLQEVQQYRSSHRAFISPIKIDKSWGFDLPWSMFIHTISLLPSQQYGLRIQKRATKDFGWRSVSVNDDAGDAGDRSGEFYEIKSSILSDPSDKMNLVQIRPWQQTHYAFLCFDLRHGNYTPYLFKLTKAELLTELDRIGASSAHGTVRANANNQKIEYRMSLNVNELDVHFARWLSLYRKSGTILDY